MTVSYDVYVHIRGEVEVDEKPSCPDDLLDSIFPDGWDGEVMDVTTRPMFCSEGHMDIIEDDEEDE